LLALSTENSSLRSKVNALQQFQESFEEIRKEVVSLRRINLQLESKQRINLQLECKQLHSKNAEAKYRSMVCLSKKLFVSLGEDRAECLKTRAFMTWLGLLINKNASSIGLAKHEAEKWRKKYEETVGASVLDTQTARREFISKCDELDVEKTHVHKLSNRVHQLAQVIAELQEQHNAELEKAVTGLSSANIKFLASPDYLSSLKKSLSPDAMTKNRNPEMSSMKMRSSLSPARTPESPTGIHVSQFAKPSPFVTPKSQAASLEQVEAAIHDCREIFFQMAKKQGADVPMEDRRVRGLTSTSITQSLDPTHAVEIMIAIVLNVFAKRKVTFPLTKISPTCYDWRGKKWHFAVHSQVLKARVGAGYEEFLSILSKEFTLDFASKQKSPASRD
jgi:hypothetical protein